MGSSALRHSAELSPSHKFPSSGSCNTAGWAVDPALLPELLRSMPSLSLPALVSLVKPPAHKLNVALTWRILWNVLVDISAQIIQRHSYLCNEQVHLMQFMPSPLLPTLSKTTKCTWPFVQLQKYNNVSLGSTLLAFFFFRELQWKWKRDAHRILMTTSSCSCRC